ncbi:MULTISPECIES: hypothetical protein [unclassified Caballeronia]|uniref:hypothetical protein n=1 Tax=unclassified Caballeronia TaxID=2646786 RepID=UPI00285C5DD9|nr:MULTISPECIES: hypothetical protein [unclassified Caballeronia]MDR5772905.1 hypothetical protein [Caballeronia sp. LZ002]MDR5803632.1 hypothetical protein [Caballeronia sp. LZ001]MDR5848339.1 hypothetical protein [Caballeronia sp. LZ003]
MANRYDLAAKAWQIHDVLQTLSAALPEDQAGCIVPVRGVVHLLIDQAQEVANKLSDLACGGDEARDKNVGGSKEDV